EPQVCPRAYADRVGELWMLDEQIAERLSVAGPYRVESRLQGGGKGEREVAAIQVAQLLHVLGFARGACDLRSDRRAALEIELAARSHRPERSSGADGALWHHRLCLLDRGESHLRGCRGQDSLRVRRVLLEQRDKRRCVAGLDLHHEAEEMGRQSLDVAISRRIVRRRVALRLLGQLFSRHRSSLWPCKIRSTLPIPALGEA